MTTANCWPIDGVKLLVAAPVMPRRTGSSVPPAVKVLPAPVTTTRLKLPAPAPVPVPSMSSDSVLPGAMTTGAAKVSVPGLLPGASVPPLCTVVAPPTVPVPRNMPSTETGETIEPSTDRVAPASMVVRPV